MLIPLTSFMRARIGGTQALRVVGAAERLFHAGGHKLLAADTRGMLSDFLSATAPKLVARAVPAGQKQLDKIPARALEAASQSARAATDVATPGAALVSTGSAVSRQLARSAGRELAKGVGRAAAIGFVVDGVISGAQAFWAVRKGRMDRGQATRFVGIEATTGALATGAGVAIAGASVALTGGLSAPVVFAIGAVTTAATKSALSRFTAPFSPEAPKLFG